MNNILKDNLTNNPPNYLSKPIKMELTMPLSSLKLTMTGSISRNLC